MLVDAGQGHLAAIAAEDPLQQAGSVNESAKGTQEPNANNVTTEHRSRSRSSSVDSLGRIKRKRSRSPPARDRSRSRSRSCSRSRSHDRRARKTSRSSFGGPDGKATIGHGVSSIARDEDDHEENALLLPQPAPPTVADHRETVKIFAEAPKEFVPPPPKRRQRRDRVGRGGSASVAGIGAASATHVEEHDFETEQEREERELAARRERRKRLLAQYETKEEGQAQQSAKGSAHVDGPQVAAAEQQQPSAGGSPEASSGGDLSPASKEARLRQQLLRRLLETRKKQEKKGGVEEQAAAEPLTQNGPHSADNEQASVIVKREDEVGVKRVSAEDAKAAETGQAENSGFDIFSQQGPQLSGRSVESSRLEEKHLASELQDEEGYFEHRVGERIKGRYKVLGTKGKGVFSSVVLAVDERRDIEVAIKVLRGNDLMTQAGLKELGILKQLTKAADSSKEEKNVIRVLNDFRVGGHVCIVMEAMNMNLRKLLKTYGANQGIAIKAVLSYTKQLLTGVQHLHSHGIVHADLKPDNIVVNTQMTVLKICDLGSALRENEVQEMGDAPYLQSRYYRAPEVVLGYPPRGKPMDMWSLATTMYEMYTSKVLFTGRDNNELLKNMVELRGGIPKKLLKKASMRAGHFDDDLNFLCKELDRVTGVESVRVVRNPQQTKQLGDMLLPAKVVANAPQEVKVSLELFKSILEPCLALDPARRLTAAQGLAMFKIA